MKNKIAIASAFVAASSLSMGEIVVNDFLSFEGFVDMSYVHYDGEADVDGLGDISESGNSFSIDQVEIVWLFDFDPVTAQVDIEYEEAGDDLEIDQAFATYHFGDGGAITAGRYDSMLGFEAFEPTGLYQYSFAYGLPNFTGDLLGAFIDPDDFEDFFDASFDDVFGAVGGAIFPLPVTNQGVKYTYEGENSFFGISIQDGVYGYSGRLGGDSASDGTAPDNGGYGFEVAGAMNFDNGISYFAGFAYEDGDGYSFTGDTSAWVFNNYVTFETGAWIFAAELSYGENEWDDTFGGVDLDVDSLSGLLMANFAYSEQASVTGRFSFVDADLDADIGGGLDGDATALKYTVAHNYAFTDNLLLVTELSYTDGDFDSNADIDGDFEELLAAVELLFTF